MIVEERTIEQAAKDEYENFLLTDREQSLGKSAFIIGAKSPEAKEFHTKGMYDDDDVWKLLNKYLDYQEHGLDNMTTIEWFEQNKKK